MDLKKWCACSKLYNFNAAAYKERNQSESCNTFANWQILLKSLTAAHNSWCLLIKFVNQKKRYKTPDFWLP